MSETAVPTAGEISRLTSACQHDPGSPLFVDLCDAYMALGRPRDAVKVAMRGLEANPDFVEGRIALARAFVSLHQWKQAQAELVKVVKVNRTFCEAFRLLGEVLLRRVDYDRAFPVLQHAQNLEPASVETLSLLKHARARKPLDPPLPVPTPLDPQSTSPSLPAVRPSVATARAAPVAATPPPPLPRARPLAPPVPPAASAAEPDDELTDGGAEGLSESADDELTQVVDEPAGSIGFDPLSASAPDLLALVDDPAGFDAPVDDDDGLEFPLLAGDTVEEEALGAEAPAARLPTAVTARAPLFPGETAAPVAAAGGSLVTGPTRVESPRAAGSAGAAEVEAARAELIRARLPLASNPTVENPAVDTPRPRVTPTPTPRPRQPTTPTPRPRLSALARASGKRPALDENYLNNLLMPEGGGKHAAAADLEVASAAWRPATRRSFTLLFAGLFVVVVGGLLWYWRAEKNRARDVARHLEVARQLEASTRHGDLEQSLSEVRKALARDRNNVYAVTVFAEVGSLSALLYQTDPAEADIATSAVLKDVERGGHRGRRELLMARSALTLAMLSAIDKPVARLAETDAAIDVWLEGVPDDAWLVWLHGRVAVASGDRRAAHAAFEVAGNAADGPVVAIIDRADMLADEGNFAEAMKLYEYALTRTPDHVLARMGVALARAERGDDLDNTKSELVELAGAGAGPRIDAYKNLALAYVHYGLEDYSAFARSLGKSVGVAEPRFLARVGLARLRAGKISDAVDVRSRIKWYGSERPEADPLVAVFDAELYLAYGLPKSALSAIGTTASLRAHSVRGRALFDDGSFAAALVEFSAALAIAPDRRDARMWQAAARFLAEPGQNSDADKVLSELTKSAKSKVPGVVQGIVYLAAGRRSARKILEESLSEVDADHPNPLAYRAQVALAELDLRAGAVDAAMRHLEEALVQNRGYLPVHALLGRAYLRQGNAVAAIAELERVVDEQMADGAAELAFAEALVAQSEVSEADRERARKAVRRAGEKQAPAAEVDRVVKLVDAELGASK